MLPLRDVFEMQNKAEEFLSTWKNNRGMHVILYGGGAGITWFLKFMKKYEIPVECVIDRNKNVHVDGGIPVMSPGEAFEEYDNAIVVIAAIAHKSEIEKFIKSERPDFIVHSFDPTLEVLQDKKYEERKAYYLQHEQELSELEALFSDQKSKEVLSDILRGALTSDVECYKHSASSSQYFPSFVRESLTLKERFVDVGAFTGDSIKEFMETVKNKFDKVYAFEPDAANIAEAYKSINDERVTFYQYGVGKDRGISYFLNEQEKPNEAVCVTQEKTDKAFEVEVVRLDDVIKDRVTYIKMDIEGMEMDALMGGRELICRYKPKLAVSVYHKMEDIIEIPYYINNLGLDYKLYLRHYWDCNGTDTILFAI